MGCCMTQSPPPTPAELHMEETVSYTVTLKSADPRKFAVKSESTMSASYGEEDTQIPEKHTEEIKTDVFVELEHCDAAGAAATLNDSQQVQTPKSPFQTRMESIRESVQSALDQQVANQQLGNFKRLYSVFEEYATNEDGTTMDIHGLTKALAVFGMIIDIDKDFQMHIFKKFDVDNEKEITYDDFSATIASFVGSNTDDDSLQTLFEIFDIDLDGYLELDDMARVLLAQNQMALVVTGQQSGQIHRYTKKQCLKQVKRMVAKHDSEKFNGNKICFDRFMAMMNSRTETDMMIDHMQTPSISINNPFESKDGTFKMKNDNN